MKAAAVLSLIVSAATLAGTGSASLGPRSPLRAPVPIATVVEHGGMPCYQGPGLPGKECGLTATITDRWITAAGFRRHALKPPERTLLLSAIGQINADYLRKHPAGDLCSAVADLPEVTYRFRGYGRPLASCTYDLRGVRAVTIVNRLISQLEPS